MKGSLLSFTRRIALHTLLGLALAVPGWAQVKEYKLTASDGAAHDWLGYSVSLSGDRALVGAFDQSGQSSGSAYVFERQGDGSWLQVFKLTTADGDANDRFGHSVSLSAERALVGAEWDDDLGSNSGSAYVYEQQVDGSWLEEAKLTASDGAEYDEFGFSVSLLRETRALIGAWHDDDMGTYSGSAYFYERQEDGSWLEVDKVTAADGAEFENFGFSVSLSGERALVGAWGDDDLGDVSGSAYVFERQGDGSWLQVFKLTAADGGAGDRFGVSVSISGDFALVGARSDDDMGTNSGSAYVFERQGDGSWFEVTKLTASDGAADDHFGWDVSLSGEHALVGAWRDDNYRGSAYVFERQGGGYWHEVVKLIASDGTGFEAFGISVSLFGDRALVGAYGHDDMGANSGAAYVLENIFSVANETPADFPDIYRLSEPYPNPFNPQAQFSLEVAQAQHVRIEVFNALGQRVGVLHEGLLSARGTHTFTFEAGLLPSGVYLLRITGETFTATRTMTLLK